MLAFTFLAVFTACIWTRITTFSHPCARFESTFYLFFSLVAFFLNFMTAKTCEGNRVCTIPVYFFSTFLLLLRRMTTLREAVVDQHGTGLMTGTFSANHFTVMYSTKVHSFAWMLTINRLNLDVEWLLCLVSTSWEGGNTRFFTDNTGHILGTLFHAFVTTWEIHDFSKLTKKVRNIFGTRSFHIMTAVWELIVYNFRTFCVPMPRKTWLFATMFVALCVRIAA